MSKQDFPNPSGRAFCCLGCGRDTRSKRGYCSNCTGGNRRGFAAAEAKDRDARDSIALSGDPADDRYEDERDDPDFQYHGSEVD